MEDPTTRPPSLGPALGREEAIHPHVVRVDAGEFRARSDYDTWREHGTTDWLLLVTVAGSGRIVTRSGRFETAPGDAVLLCPGVQHDYGTAGASWSLAFAHFHPRAEWSPLLDWPEPTPGAGLVPVADDVRPRVLEALRAAVRAASGSLPRSQLFAVNALETALLWIDTQNPLRGGMDPRLLRVVEHIGAELAGDLSVPALARVAHLSPSRLGDLFRRSLGLSPQRYVERERLARAAAMLASTTRSVSDVARDVGWDDPLYFSRRFRRLHGVSPTAFRDGGGTRQTP